MPLSSLLKTITRNSSVGEGGERCRLNHAIVVKLYHAYTQFPRNVRLSLSSANRDFFCAVRAHHDSFDTFTYLLIDLFAVDNYLWQLYGITFKQRGGKLLL